MSSLELLNIMRDFTGECYVKDDEIKAANQRTEYEKKARCTDSIKHKNKTVSLEWEHGQQDKVIKQMSKDEDALRKANDKLRKKLKAVEDKVTPHGIVFAEEKKRYISECKAECKGEVKKCKARCKAELATKDVTIRAQKEQIRDLETMVKYNTGLCTETAAHTINSQNDTINDFVLQERYLVRQVREQDIVIKEQQQHIVGLGNARVEDVRKNLAHESELRVKAEEIEKLKSRVAGLESRAIPSKSEKEVISQEVELQKQEIEQQAAAQIDARDRDVNKLQQEVMRLLDLLQGNGVVPDTTQLSKDSLDEEMIDAGYDSGYDEDLDCIE
jgi:uncharacterized coiled-coil protein SlyX